MTFLHYYTLTPEWQQQLVDFFGATLIDNKILVLPESVGQGGSYFLSLMPGISVLLIDVTFNIEVTLTRRATQDDFCIVYYDLSDEISYHIINNEYHKIGYRAKLGLGVVDSAVESTYIPKVGERVYSLRLFVDKKLLQEASVLTMKTVDQKQTPPKSANTLFHYSHIDSRSKIVLHQLKHRRFSEPAFDLLLRGVAYTLFTYLMESASKLMPQHSKLAEKDVKGLMLTERYLLEHLTEEFPGIGPLSSMAGMSPSKYKQLFKKIFGDSPNSFFLNEKLLLAQHLLENGKFKTVSEVAYELGYSKPGYFSAGYRKKFGRLPGEVLSRRQLT